MDPIVNPSQPSAAGNDAATTLMRHFPLEVRTAYDRFRANRSADDADVVVLAVVLDHMPDKSRRPVSAPADSLGLMADLGFDSIAITEMVFFLEDLFQVRISNEEILRVQTLGDLRSFLRQKLAAAVPTSA